MLFRSLAAESGLPCGPSGRIEIDDRLRVLSHPEILAVGDIAAARDAHGYVLAQVAQAAIQGGRYAGRSVAAELAGRPTRPFRYRDRGTMATIGRHAAVAELPFGVRLWGVAGWAAWLGLHLVYLVGFRNRASVLIKWAWNYLTYDYANRLLVSDDS